MTIYLEEAEEMSNRKKTKQKITTILTKNLPQIFLHFWPPPPPPSLTYFHTHGNARNGKKPF